MTLPWCRLYTEFASDPKIQILAFEDQRHYVMLLCLKGNGTLDAAAPSAEYHERLIAKALGLDPASAAEAKRRLVEVGLIDKKWNPRSWDKRQFPSDSSTSRVQKYRMKRNGNVSETLQEQSCNAVDERRGEEKREDSEKIKKRRRASAAPKKVPSSTVPHDFVPDVAQALAKVPDMDVEAEVEKFRLWEFDPPRSNWASTWHNWVQRARDNGKYSRKQATVRKWD